MDQTELSAIYKKADLDGSGEISFNEFSSVLLYCCQHTITDVVIGIDARVGKASDESGARKEAKTTTV